VCLHSPPQNLLTFLAMLPKTLSRAYIYHELFATFDIDINNAQNGISPSSLRDYIAAARRKIFLLHSAFLQMVFFTLTIAQHALIEP